MVCTTKLGKGHLLAPALTHDGYAAGFKAFRSLSSERTAMFSWIREKLLVEIPDKDHFSILSVGCGSGDFDLGLIEILKSKIKHIEYVAVEPNHVHCQQSSVRLATTNLTDVQCHIHPVPFEGFRTDRHFDLVHFSHSLYYIPDREAAILSSMNLIRETGRVLILHQTPLGINQIQRRFLERIKGDKKEMFCSHDLQRVLEDHRIDYNLDVIDSFLDITGCFQFDSALGENLLNFFLECDTHDIPPATKQELIHYLQQLSFSDDQGRRLLYQPVAIFSLFNKPPR